MPLCRRRYRFLPLVAAMVNPTVFFDITADDEPLGRVSFEVGWAVVLQGGVLGGGGGGFLDRGPTLQRSERGRRRHFLTRGHFGRPARRGEAGQAADKAGRGAAVGGGGRPRPSRPTRGRTWLRPVGPCEAGRTCSAPLPSEPLGPALLSPRCSPAGIFATILPEPLPLVRSGQEFCLRSQGRRLGEPVRTL